MGNSQKLLQSLIEDYYGKQLRETSKRPSKDEFYESDFHHEIKSIYYDLSGRWDDYPTNYGGNRNKEFYDIVLHDGNIIELDEEQHFNHYRFKTFLSPIYRYLRSNFSRNYSSFCHNYEDKCLKKAGRRINYWKTNGSEKQFGVSNEPGNLDPPGSSRWKQRAFYDFLRDVSQLMLENRLVRLSFWDTIIKNEKEDTVYNILTKNDYSWHDPLLEHIDNLLYPKEVEFDFDPNGDERNENNWARIIRNFFKRNDPDFQEYHPISIIIPVKDTVTFAFLDNKRSTDYDDINLKSFKDSSIVKFVEEFGHQNAVNNMNRVLFSFLIEQNKKANETGNESLPTKWLQGINRFIKLKAGYLLPDKIDILEPGLRKIRHNGIIYDFTLKQSKALKFMYDGQIKENKKDFIQLEILSGIYSTQFRLRDLFKSHGRIHDAWDSLIIMTKRGRYRLNI